MYVYVYVYISIDLLIIGQFHGIFKYIYIYKEYISNLTVLLSKILSMHQPQIIIVLPPPPPHRP